MHLNLNHCQSIITIMQMCLHSNRPPVINHSSMKLQSYETIKYNEIAYPSTPDTAFKSRVYAFALWVVVHKRTQYHL